MKQKCSFILKASMALILALVMLFGTVATSLAAVVDEADTAAQAEDIADTGANVDLAESGYSNQTSLYIYFDNTNMNFDTSSGYNYFARVSDWGEGAASQVDSMSLITGTNLLYTHPTTYNYGGSNLWYHLFLHAGNSVGSGKWNISTDTNFTVKTTTYGMSFTDGGTYLMSTTGSDLPRAQTAPASKTGYSALNTDLTVKTMRYDGTSYSEYNTKKLGTFSDSGAYKLTAQGTSGTSDFSQTNGTGTLTTALTNTATISQTAEAGYVFQGWKATSDSTGSGLTTGTYSYTNAGSATTIYAYYKPKTAPLKFDINGGTGGTLPADSALSATYDAAMPTISGYVAPTKTGYELEGWYYDLGGSNQTKYYNANGTSANQWKVDTSSATTLKAKWNEVTGTARAYAYTNGAESGTGGNVKVGSGSPGAQADITGIGIVSNKSVLKASVTEGYEFKGWQTAGTESSHLQLYTDSGCTTRYVKATDGALDTIYVKTDGASGLNSSNAKVYAIFDSIQNTITYSAEYSDDGSTWNTLTSSQGAFTVTNNNAGDASVASGSTVNYGTMLTITATPVSGYAVDAIYYSSGSGDWNKMGVADYSTGEAAVNSTFEVKANWEFKAHFIKVQKLSAFDSYELTGSTDNDVHFITSPPKKITIKHTYADTANTTVTYTYTYDASAAKGNPNTPNASGCPAALSMATSNYGAGNYIQFYPGDEITLTYSGIAASELLKGVFYNNPVDYEIVKPTASQFFTRNYKTCTAIYMDADYYSDEQLGTRDPATEFASVVVDQDAHSIKFTAANNDYKNIDVEIAAKRKIYFSDTKNAVVTSKNTDNYYFDNEPLSVEGDQFTVAAAQSSSQTNKIDNAAASTTKPAFYKANADGSKGDALDSTEISTYDLAIETGTSTSTSAANGTALEITGNMPPFDLYIDLNMQNSYTLKAASKIISDPENAKYFKTKASTIQITCSGSTLNAPGDNYVSSTSLDCLIGNTITLTASGFTSGYMFVGWYWGKSDNSGPDFDKGFISNDETFTFAPRRGGSIWALGTKNLYINGSMYITGKTYASGKYWNEENDSWKNLLMSFDPSRGENGSYYWEITEDMLITAGNDFKYVQKSNGSSRSDTEGWYFPGDNNTRWYWCDNDEKYHGKAYFQLVDTETGNASREIWKTVYGFKETKNGVTYGKILKKDTGETADTENQRLNGQGFIDFSEARYAGYSAPLRIYYDAAAKALAVEATPIYSDIYVSNGFNVGSTLRTDAVTVQPVYNGNVVTSDQTGYFDVGAGTTYSPDSEGQVKKYTPAKKNATVRITKETRGGDKVAAFFIYDIVNKTVRAEKNITAGIESDSKTPYYTDITLEGEKQQLYIVPIIEEKDANVTVTFDATQLNREKWGDIVTAYAWYQNNGGASLGAYPGQPMIPDDSMSSWTTTFKAKNKDNKEIEGITFSNYVDGIHTWLGTKSDDTAKQPVMGTVTYTGAGTESDPIKYTFGTDGLIQQYNLITSGDYNEYTRGNCKAQTYDYREPISLYNRFKSADSTSISFTMKDGNSNLLSRQHTQLTDVNILTLNQPSTGSTYTWSKLKWEYLTNAKGDQYIDMNGQQLGVNSKPSASFYVAAKGQVMYDDSDLTYVFNRGKDYEAVTDVTYGGADGVSMDYGVQWYVYDAEGNYITNVLSAGIADQATGTTMTYIAKQLEDMGYAVDGKSVAMCYDKPRYMYGDSSNSGAGAVSYSGKRINVGNDFDAYRFTGQWNAVASTETVKVSVGVAMMTSSGEVLANSNVAGYGNATAALKSGVTFGQPTYAATSVDGSWAQTAVSDAKLNGIELNASATNFQGWYYYDANTEEFTKASFASNEHFCPNYSNKDVTYYAVYEASAVYQYHYNGRQGERIYSATGNDLTAAEMTDGNKINASSHESDIKSKVPTGIGVFKKTMNFSASNYGSWGKTADPNGYILDITGITSSDPDYTLTAYYKDANGKLITGAVTGKYNGLAVNLTTALFVDSDGNNKPSGTPVTNYYTGHRFIGWYAYDGSTKGDLLSTQANYGLRLTRDQPVIAVYDNEGSSLPDDGWTVKIDENVVNRELTSSTTGVYYNDTIVRVRNGSDVKAQLPDGAKIGILLVTDDGKATKEPESYTDENLATLASSIASGSSAKTKSGLVVTNLQAASQTSFNRTDIAVTSDYAKTKNSTYCVYAYIRLGDNNYKFSSATAETTYD